MSEVNKKILKSTWLWIKFVMLPPALIYLIYGELLFEFLGNRPFMICYMFAAMCNAVMSSVDNKPHYYASRFSGWNPNYWCKEISWDKAFRIGSYKFDAWHNFQSAMIIALIFGGMINGQGFDYKSLFSWIDLAMNGYLYNIVFSAFYDIIFRKKQA